MVLGLGGVALFRLGVIERWLCCVVNSVVASFLLV